ncbi:MAG TPA: regulatory protein RecX [Streptosporangiaceae bacterium]|jgi:regulatory protein
MRNKRVVVDSDDVRQDDPEASAMAVCLRLLTAAPRTRAQLEEALHRRGIPPRAADAVMERLIRAKLIDDAAFAQAWVETRHYSRGLARRALSAELRQRGVDEDSVQDAVAELSPEQEEAAARRMVAAKLAATRGRPLPTRMRRLMGLLARKGYPPGLAYRVVREALDQEGIDLAESGIDLDAMLDADTSSDADDPQPPTPDDEI